MFIFGSDKGREIAKVTKILAAELTRSRIAVRKLLSSTFLNGKIKSYRKPIVEDFDPIVYTADIKRKTPQAYGDDLDSLGFIFGISRRSGEADEVYRQRIKFNIKSSTSKEGIKDSIKFAVTNSNLFPDVDLDVEIRESYKDFFDGASTPLNAPVRSVYGSLVGGITIYIRPKGRLIGSNMKQVAIDYQGLVDKTETPTLKTTLEILVSAGIVIDRVIFEQVGASGNMGEFYSYYETPGRLRNNVS